MIQYVYILAAICDISIISRGRKATKFRKAITFSREVKGFTPGWGKEGGGARGNRTTRWLEPKWPSADNLNEVLRFSTRASTYDGPTGSCSYMIRLDPGKILKK